MGACGGTRGSPLDPGTHVGTDGLDALSVVHEKVEEDFCDATEVDNSKEEDEEADGGEEEEEEETEEEDRELSDID